MEVTEKDQAAAYLKLQDDVKELILSTVLEALVTNPSGELAGRILFMADKHLRDLYLPNLVRKDDLQNLRLTPRGQVAPW